jgi:hypothetical protein
MPPLRIPQRYRAGLTSVDALTDEDATLLAEGLDAEVAEVSFAQLAAPLRDDIEADVDLERLLDAVASLITLLPEDESGVDSLAQDVSESESLDLPPERRPAYVARLRKLMSVPALAVAARATELVGEHDKAFHDVRIFTDVRPVFERDVSTGVKMATVVAMMRLDYHPGGRSAIESVFVGLERGDLEHLRNVVDRAIAKMDSLSELMKETHVPRWTPTFHEHDSA